jgi:glycerol-3-phosphate dehydrogenase
MSVLSRKRLLNDLRSTRELWDFVVIGGGATGLGAAVDAAARGHRTLLLEQHDFAKGTSSRSTKLVHGGVRYLKQGNISLVLEALRERGILCQNAPHLVHHQAFVVPIYTWWEGPFYGIGLKVYDQLAGRLGLAPSKILSLEETIELIPTIETDGLREGVIYFDGQFDDARLAIDLMQTVFDLGAVALNYMKVIRMLKKNGLVAGVVARDEETGEEFELPARGVINATGVFADYLRRLDQEDVKPMLQPSQGAHIVLPKAFLPGDTAIMVPHTSDGRVLFAVPWHDCVIVGTTDTPVHETSLEPRPLADELEFLFTHAAKYLSKDPTPSDALSVFAGLRPLVSSGSAATAAISRDHTIVVSQSGLVTITGGKWTTYRRMAQDIVDQAEIVAGMKHRPCTTEHLAIHGATTDEPPAGLHPQFRVYGSEAKEVEKLIQQNPEWARPIIEGLPYLRAEVVFAVRREMARTVEDVLARRTRALLVGARLSIEAAPAVAEIMAAELGFDEGWQASVVEQFEQTAQGYLPP